MLEWIALKGGCIRTWANMRHEGGAAQGLGLRKRREERVEARITKREETVAADRLCIRLGSLFEGEC
jgi:hypothetical protein